MTGLRRFGMETTRMMTTENVRAEREPVDAEARIELAFLREEIERERLAVQARIASLVVIGVWIASLMPFREALFYHALILVFCAIGYGHYFVTEKKSNRAVPRLALIAADYALLTFTLIADNPLNDWQMPPPLRLENGGFAFFFVILAGASLNYSASRMAASAILGAAAWSAGYWWVAAQPGSFSGPIKADASVLDWIEAHKQFNFVDMAILYQDLIVFGIVAAILTMTVVRSRRLVREQAKVARERGNLARYFPPNMVDRLAGQDEPLGAVRTQRVAVLFADLVGFTAWAERRPATEVIARLRQVHGRLETCVFDHGGTLDKFLGDGLMATFGTPDVSEGDAANAIECAKAMVTAINAWNEAEPGREPVRLSVGVQYGEVVIGDIGSARRMEFTVLGDTVNIASRLEAATRELGCSVLIGAPAMEAALAAGRSQIRSWRDAAAVFEGVPVKGHAAVKAYGLN